MTEKYAYPLGTSQKGPLTCFTLYSKKATQITLHLFAPREKLPFLEVAMEKPEDAMEGIWHIALEDLPPLFAYAYRVDGSAEFLLDPYAKEVATLHSWGISENEHFEKALHMPFTLFDWEGVKAPNHPRQELIIYEMQVRSFTQDSSSRVEHPGTFLGILEKIPYLKNLGVNAIELMPIFEFNECYYPRSHPRTNERLFNMWGYATVNFFAPMNRFAASLQWGAASLELKTLVRELHRNGIEVFLDVVYNHTGEEGKTGPTFSYKGIDRDTYYLLDEQGDFLDFSGTGNTLNANESIVSRLILDSMRWWVEEFHIDGFRFDLASCLTRDQTGKPLKKPPIFSLIEQDPLFIKTKLIAEPWDAAGLYQLGFFPSLGNWSEWNGRYRDVVRRFLKGTDGEVGHFATALCGSQDLYGNTSGPCHSINFVTAHDGFTLRDLVSYQEKHNEGNGEENRDGSDNNDSWNCGVEGPTKESTVVALREKQMRNFHLALMLSLGTPMLLMGDEYGHTKQGNNNTWCQDNALNWFQWNHQDDAFFRFFTLAIRLRKEKAALRQNRFLSPEDIDWHGLIPFHPDWGPKNRFLAYTLKETHLYVAFNAHFSPALLHLPPPPADKNWYRLVDTSLPSPQDFLEKPLEEKRLDPTYTLPPYSAFVAELC